MPYPQSGECGWGNSKGIGCIVLELDRCIGNTDHRGRLWDNRNNLQMMTIGDRSVPMFHDDVIHRIHLVMGSIGHSCSLLFDSRFRAALSLMTILVPGLFL